MRGRCIYEGVGPVHIISTGSDDDEILLCHMTMMRVLLLLVYSNSRCAAYNFNKGRNVRSYGYLEVTHIPALNLSVDPCGSY